MKIKLFNSFFGPDSQLRKPGMYDVPEDWDLPKGTKVLEDDDKPVAKKPAAKSK